MIIDLILDRHDNEACDEFSYSAHDFYWAVSDYYRIDGVGKRILYAMDELEEPDVQKAICDYVTGNEYNPKICDYIKSRKWLEDDNGKKLPLVTIVEPLYGLTCYYKDTKNGIYDKKWFPLTDFDNAIKEYTDALQNDLYSKVTLEKYEAQ